MNKFINQLTISLGQELKPDGFVKLSGCILGKEHLDRIDRILLGSRKDTTSGMEKCTFSLGVRFPKIEAILDPDDDHEPRSTIGLPIHMLTQDQRFTEWPLGAQSFDSTRDNILVWIRKHAFPFFETFKTVDSIAEKLSKDDPSEWFVMTPVRRSEVLAACLVILHRESEAVSHLEDQIELNRDKLPKYRLPLQRLLQQLNKK